MRLPVVQAKVQAGVAELGGEFSLSQIVRLVVVLGSLVLLAQSSNYKVSALHPITPIVLLILQSVIV